MENHLGSAQKYLIRIHSCQEGKAIDVHVSLTIYVISTNNFSWTQGDSDFLLAMATYYGYAAQYKQRVLSLTI